MVKKCVTRIKPNGSVKAPEYSHTAGRIYTIVQKGGKHLTYYDENHNQAVSIDLTVPHKGKLPHKHLYWDHNTAYDITETERNLIKQIKKEYHLK